MSDLNSSNLTTNIPTTESLYLNLTTLNTVTNVEAHRNLFLNFDNKAKEIILLSTAFATMLLSMCFLIFIAWFCCITVLKDKRIKSTSKQIKKSIKESETNIQMASLKRPSLKNGIHVRDDCEHEKKSKSPRSKLFSKQELPKPSEDTLSYHAYDILDISTKNYDSPKLEKEKFKEKLNRELSRGAINHAFINDDSSRRYIDFNTQSTIALNKALKNKKSGHVSKNSTLRNQPKLSREQIEREFYEYTLECRKKLNELFEDSPSSCDTFKDSSSEKEKLTNDYNTLKLKLKHPCLTMGKKTNKKDQIWHI
ncbi:unnamed protein product [Brachionus calyciflorus]|uniref:Uncharacterized protein n=1 Tax=Brachionus calyciflorus TaxID=104777 RepID=A0A813YK80_9BILA|nr:unnamed protein product [Brachionus calyciflorus]